MNEDLEEALFHTPPVGNQVPSFFGLFQDLSRREYLDALLFLGMDTSATNPFQRQVEIVKGMGFELASQGKVSEDHAWFMAWRRGILIFFSTDSKHYVADAYFNYVGPAEALSRRTSSAEQVGVTEEGPLWVCKMSIVEGFKHNLECLEERGRILEEWAFLPELDLVLDVERKSPDFCPDDAVDAKLRTLPVNVTDAMFGR